mgnify:FL=1
MTAGTCLMSVRDADKVGSMSLAVVTDSAACLTESLVRDRAIEVVPLHAVPAEDGGHGTTTSPSVEALAEAYRRAAQRAEEVLAVHISSTLSGTLDNARTAAARLTDEHGSTGQGGAERRRRPQWLRVVDSGTSSGALGLAVLAATRAHDARRGAALAQASTARSYQYFIVEDLGRLARSGRIDRTTARLGGALGIRPVLALTRDGIRAVETVRGAARARRHLIEQAVRAAGGTALSGPRHPADPVRLVIQGDDADMLEQLETDLQEAMEEAGAIVTELLTLPIDEATRTHVGPGALGIAVAPDLRSH